VLISKFSKRKQISDPILGILRFKKRFPTAKIYAITLLGQQKGLSWKKNMSKITQKSFLTVSAALLLGACGVQSDTQPITNGASASNIQGNEAVRTKAKNVIIFIGDGMGVSTVTAARIFDGQSKGLKGEEHALAFEDFENLALIKTYNTNAPLQLRCSPDIKPILALLMFAPMRA